MKIKKIISIPALILFVLIFSGCSVSDLTGGTSSSSSAVTSLWRSVDGGETWEVLKDEKINLAKFNILSLEINPNNPDNVYAGLKEAGILKTDDGGKSWQYLKFQAEKVYGLAIDPNNPNALVASGVWQGRGKIWKTYDRGENWEEIYTFPAEGPMAISLALDDSNSDIIYFSTSEGEIIKSWDGGATWQKIFSAPAPITKMVISPTNSLTIYFLSNNGSFYKTADGGGSVEDISEKFSSLWAGKKALYSLAVDKKGIIYLGGESGLIKSSNQGDDWELIETVSDSAKFPIRAIGINPANGNEIFYGAARAAYKSVNGGESWATSQFDTSKIITNLKYSLSDSKIIYLSVSELK